MDQSIAANAPKGATHYKDICGEIVYYRRSWVYWMYWDGAKEGWRYGNQHSFKFQIKG